MATRLGMQCVNLAQPGASNDFIVRTAVNAIEEYCPKLMIVAFTTPNRFERNGEHFTPTKTPQQFIDWNDYLGIGQVSYTGKNVRNIHHL